MRRDPKQPTCRLSIRVTTRSSKPRIQWDGAKLQVWVSSPPTEGQANEAALRLLADALDLPFTSLSIVRGGHSREKLVEIAGLELERAIERLVD